MTHRMKWIIDKRVVLFTYTGVIDKAELIQLKSELASLLKDNDEVIHIIADTSALDGISVDLQAFEDVFIRASDYQWGWIILVGAAPFIQFFARIISHAFRLKLKIVDTLDDAKHALINEEPELASHFQSQTK